jgi:hypothetical protein
MVQVRKGEIYEYKEVKGYLLELLNKLFLARKPIPNIPSVRIGYMREIEARVWANSEVTLFRGRKKIRQKYTVFDLLNLASKEGLIDPVSGFDYNQEKELVFSFQSQFTDDIHSEQMKYERLVGVLLELIERNDEAGCEAIALEIVSDMVGRSMTTKNLISEQPATEELYGALVSTFRANIFASTLAHSVEVMALMSLLLGKTVFRAEGQGSRLLSDRTKQYIENHYEIILMLALLHDLGKLSPEVNSLFISASSRYVDSRMKQHTGFGLRLMFEDPVIKGFAQHLSWFRHLMNIIIGGHHGSAYGAFTDSARVFSYTSRRDFMEKTEARSACALRRYADLQGLVLIADKVSTIFGGRPYYVPKSVSSLERSCDPIVESKFWGTGKQILSHCAKTTAGTPRFCR